MPSAATIPNKNLEFRMKTFLSSRALPRAAALAVLTLSALGAQAASFAYSGQATYHNDLIKVSFHLDADSTDVKVWTDSWLAGLNFDPVIAVWAQTGAGYNLLSQVDDDDTIGAGQGSYDAGIKFTTLAAGHYLVTLAAAPNFAKGTTLADGFAFDGETAIALADWKQPSYDLNKDDQKGGYWSLRVTAVPEPASWALMAGGLALGLVARRRRGA